MKLPLLLPATCIALLTACAAPSPQPSTPAPGADRDAQGCIASAGYAWCARTRQCERPWELAQARAFPNTPQAFAAFCQATP